VDRFETRRTAADRFGARRTAAGRTAAWRVAAWRVGWAVVRGPVARRCRAAVVHSRPEHPGEPATAVPAGAPTREAEKAASSRRWPATAGAGSWSPASRPAGRAERQRAAHRPAVHRWVGRRRAGPREGGQAAVGSTRPARAGSCSTAGLRPTAGLVAPGWPMPGPAGHRLAAAGSATHPPVAECRRAVDRAVERRPGCRAAVWPRAGRCRAVRCQAAHCQGARCRAGRWQGGSRSAAPGNPAVAGPTMSTAPVGPGTGQVAKVANCSAVRRSTEPTPVARRSAGQRRPPTGRHPAEPHPAEPHPVERHPVGPHPVERRPVERRPVGPHPVERHSVGPHQVERHAVERHPLGPEYRAEPRPAWTVSWPVRPPVSRPVCGGHLVPGRGRPR